jgi:hypothetical protein
LNAQVAARQNRSVASCRSSTLELTPAQRNAIYRRCTKNLSKVPPGRFATDVGVDVPIIDLCSYPTTSSSTNPRSEVVLVDPTKMRVIDRVNWAQRQ